MYWYMYWEQYRMHRRGTAGQWRPQRQAAPAQRTLKVSSRLRQRQWQRQRLLMSIESSSNLLAHKSYDAEVTIYMYNHIYIWQLLYTRNSRNWYKLTVGCQRFRHSNISDAESWVQLVVPKRRVIANEYFALGKLMAVSPRATCSITWKQ